MFKMIKTKNTGPIGLDISSTSIRMIQLAQSGQEIEVIAADETHFDPAVINDVQKRKDFTINAIKKMVANGNFVGTDVISSLSNDTLKVKSLRLDTNDAKQIEATLRKEVANRFSLNADSAEVRYIIAGDAYQGDEIKNEIIIFAADNETIRDHIDILEKAALTPLSIDPVPCALFRSFQRALRRQADKDIVSVFVDVGSNHTTVIIGKGQQIAFIKQIPIAGNHLNRKVAEDIGITEQEAAVIRTKMKSPTDDTLDAQARQTVIDAMRDVIEELAKEVSLCFKYYAVTFRGQRPDQAVFTGAEAYETTLLNSLKRHLGIEIKVAEPLRGFNLTGASLISREHPAMCEWATAVGLSIKGWELPDEVSGTPNSNSQENRAVGKCD
jgi:type IV pilus assembly protein PilM